ncbi:hypothetical protein H337_10050 [Vibrio parahaemolyticus EN9701121]|nr:hypothetical protein H337_10050 [Vibrio parahaemolyticus EN9701121]
MNEPVVGRKYPQAFMFEGIFMLAHWLVDVDDFASPDSLTLFRKELPLERINQALDETNKASMRRRKLPIELVDWSIGRLVACRCRLLSRQTDY